MHGCLRPLAAALFGLCLAGPASADLLRWEGTLTLDFIRPTLSSPSFPGGGVVQLVTPIQIVTTVGSGHRLGLFGVLEITFVPEPSSELLLGAGFAGLALAGRQRRRHPYR